MNAALFPDLIVNGELVSHALVAAETQNHDAPKGKPGIAWRKAARAIAVRTLLLQEARSRGIAAEPDEVGSSRFETEEEALIWGLLETAVNVAAPSEPEIRAEWERDPARFRTPPLWDVSHILIACDPRDTAAREKAERRATTLAELATGEPKGFAALAVRESDCGSKASGGALRQLGPGDTVPEFEVILRTLSEGQITATPVLTRYGFHIVRMDAAALGRVLPFDAVRDKIALALEKARWASAAKAFVGELIDTADIKGAELDAA
ncbi:MAG: peptidylprolyl isomerase [Rhodobacter sp.]|nr:peptidylprolyl isomerase [Rhodobacter sp.]MCY4241542.1 peptidylprolyl isomerase [Rhodobacter sp.]